MKRSRQSGCRRSRLWRRSFLGVLVTALVATPAQAHLVTTGLGPFYDGLSHFTATMQDLLPAIALALLAGLRGAAHGRTVLFVLPAAWLAGGTLGLLLGGPETVGVLSVLSFVVLGGLVAADTHLTLRWTLALTVVLGLVHGYLNGAAMQAARLGALGLLGIVVALFVVIALVSAFVLTLRADWMRIAVRVAGSWLVAIGLLMLGWSLRGG